MINCAFCGEETEVVMDFGRQALAGGFLKAEEIGAEQRYPLRVAFCPSCTALQIADPVERETLFSNYFYLSSATRTVREHAKRYAESLVTRFSPQSVLEVGCNDGVLLSQLAGRVPVVVGVDPAKNVTAMITDPRVRVETAFFDDSTDVGQFDMVVANNVFAHVRDIHAMTRGIARALKPDGVFVFEVHDLVRMLDDLQYDWIYHEHLYYYSLGALEKHLQAHGLRIFAVESVALHGGSRRYFACKDARPEDASVRSVRGIERMVGVDQVAVFRDFSAKARTHAATLRGTLEILHDSGLSICGYGASGRASALIQHAGLGSLLYGVHDDAPAKWGHVMPGSHVPILSGAVTADVTCLFAWTYLEEIRPKCRGSVVVPFPAVREIEPERVAA